MAYFSRRTLLAGESWSALAASNRRVVKVQLRRPVAIKLVRGADSYFRPAVLGSGLVSLFPLGVTMPQCLLANAAGEDGRDDASSVARLCNGEGKVIVEQSLRKIVGRITRVLSTEGAGVESDGDPRLACIQRLLSALVGDSVRERGSRGTPATAGSSETGKTVKETLVHCAFTRERRM
jgi:hypothetical protein